MGNEIRLLKNQQVRGESVHQSVLDARDVREIKDLLRAGEYTMQAIADRYGVSRPSISSIKSGRTWKHIP
jgi:hypothetical protein